MEIRKHLATILGIVFGVLLIAPVVLGFTSPTQAPPGGNVFAPLNAGNLVQEKLGGLILNTGGAAVGLVVDQGKVGIGTPNPANTLSVNGIVEALSILQTGSVALPSCTQSNRGQEYLLQGASGTEDGFYICKKKSDDTYGWIALGSPDLKKAFESAGSSVTVYGHDSSVPPSSPYGDWVTAHSFTVPAEAKTWSCSFGIHEPNSFSLANCPSVSARLVCDGNTEHSGGCPDYGCVLNTPIFAELDQARNCQWQLSIPAQPCGDNPYYSVNFNSAGMCTYAEAKQ